MNRNEYPKALALMGFPPGLNENICEYVKVKGESYYFKQILSNFTGISPYADVFPDLDFKNFQRELKEHSLETVLIEAWHQKNALNYSATLRPLVESNEQKVV